MLAIYRRHRDNCPQVDDRVSKKCRCAIWLTGTLFGKAYRRSAKTRNWEAAEKIKRAIESGNVKDDPSHKAITVQEATASFIKDCKSRNLNFSTLGKYERLCRAIDDFAAANNVRNLAEWTPEASRDFRNAWTLSPRTAIKQLERFRAFFNFCVENDWLPKNPAKPIKSPIVRQVPRMPFNEKEVESIIAKASDDRELAFVLVLRHTGLRIGDASLLRVSQMSESRIVLYTTKAGVPVSVVIPPSLCSLLKALPTPGGYFFLRGESTNMHTTANTWRRSIKKMCKDAGVKPDHPHRFRHTLAADLLIKGASVEDVAAILGNSPQIVQKHYSQFIKARQDRLDAIVSSTWETPKLKRIK